MPNTSVDIGIVVAVVSHFATAFHLHRTEVLTMRSLAHPGKDRSPAPRANGNLTKSIGEPHPIRGKLVERGRLDQLVAVASEHIAPLVVRQEEDDVFL